MCIVLNNDRSSKLQDTQWNSGGNLGAKFFHFNHTEKFCMDWKQSLYLRYLPSCCLKYVDSQITHFLSNNLCLWRLLPSVLRWTNFNALLSSYPNPLWGLVFMNTVSLCDQNLTYNWLNFLWYKQLFLRFLFVMSFCIISQRNYLHRRCSACLE